MAAPDAWQLAVAMARGWRAWAAMRPTAPPATDVTASRRLQLGDRSVRIDHWHFGRGGALCINLHENERTAVDAARAVLRDTGGDLLVLRAGGQRRVAFRIGLRAVAVDPNRIYSPPGLAATLQRHGGDFAAARAAAESLAEAVLASLADAAGTPGAAGAAQAPVIALHNTRADGYSVLAYRPGGVHAAAAAEVAVNAEWAPEDFFIVTRRAHFEALRAQGFNTVLEAPDAPDDGSLSVWFNRRGRAYINVEALHGHLAQQQRMIAAAVALA